MSSGRDARGKPIPRSRVSVKRRLPGRGFSVVRGQRPRVVWLLRVPPLVSPEGSVSTLAEKIAILPAVPGVYLFKDGSGEVLYVGKANSLAARVRNYLGS